MGILGLTKAYVWLARSIRRVRALRKTSLAFLLGILPLIQAGSGAMAARGPEGDIYLSVVQLELGKIDPQAVSLILFPFGVFSWGWSYNYVGAHGRMAIAVVMGLFITFAAVATVVYLLGCAFGEEHGNPCRWTLPESLEQPALGLVVGSITVAAVFMAIDAARIARRQTALRAPTTLS